MSTRDLKGDQLRGRVLSIQSHVVTGYVGNRAATLPLQLHGFETDVINSVQLSNHSVYPVRLGQKFDGSVLKDLFMGLQQNDLDFYTHVITGYAGSLSFLAEAEMVVKKLKAKNPNLFYACDPVMGDNDHFYVPQELCAFYKSNMVPMADLITPNKFEAELLSGQKIRTEEDAIGAVTSLLGLGPSMVVITSIDVDPSAMVALAGTRGSDGIQVYRIQFEKLDMTFSGTGDMFTALFVAWLHKSGSNIEEALSMTISTMNHVLHKTHDGAQGKGVCWSSNPVFLRELRIVDSVRFIMNPEKIYQAELVRSS